MTTLAPKVPFLLIIGTVLCAVAPPLGVLLIVLAIPAQRRYRRRSRQAYQQAHAAAYVKARDRAMRDRILAAKSLP